jgi:hypothetical protein
MGNIIQIENGIKTIYVNGQNISSLSAETNTYYVGVDLTSGSYEKLNPNGTVINLEAGSIIPTTYSDLVNTINAYELILGSYYSFDFTTTYDQPDFYIDSSPKNTVLTKNGVNKTLIVLATSNSTISTNAYSPNYPSNKYKYDWTTNATEVNGNPMEGKITELIDSNNNRTDYDHEDVLFTRYQSYDKNSQLTGTISDFDCTTGSIVGVGTIFLSEVNPGDILLIDTKSTYGYDVGVKVLSVVDDTNLAVHVDITYTGTIFSSGAFTFFNSIASGVYDYFREVYVAQNDEGDYLEVQTFNGTINNYVGDSLGQNSPFYLANNVLESGSSNIIGNYSVNNNFNTNFSNNKIGDYCYNNIIGIDFTNNKINNEFYYNKIYDGFSSNSIENKFYENIVGTSAQYNIINNEFSDNIVGSDFSGNKIGTGCINNTFGINFGYGPDKLNGNIIGDNCDSNIFGSLIVGFTAGYNNIIGNNCKNNTFGIEFIDNNFGNYCQSNTIGDYCQSNTIDDYFGNTTLSNTIYDYFQYNKIGNFFGNNTNFPTVGGGSSNDGGNIINNNFRFNEIGDNFIWNIIDDNFSYNKIGTDFWINIFGQNTTHNVIGDLFVGNVGTTGFPNPIGDNFTSNEIGNYTPYNKIGTNFTYNKIGHFFGNAGVGTENTIGNNFMDNNIFNYFGDDGSHVSGGNTIIDDFTLNNVESDKVNGFDFTLATYVYGDYNCTIFRRSDGTNRLSYFDSGDTLTIDNVDA